MTEKQPGDFKEMRGTLLKAVAGDLTVSLRSAQIPKCQAKALNCPDPHLKLAPALRLSTAARRVSLVVLVDLQQLANLSASSSPFISSQKLGVSVP